MDITIRKVDGMGEWNCRFTALYEIDASEQNGHSGQKLVMRRKLK